MFLTFLVVVLALLVPLGAAHREFVLVATTSFENGLCSPHTTKAGRTVPVKCCIHRSTVERVGLGIGRLVHRRSKSSLSGSGAVVGARKTLETLEKCSIGFMLSVGALRLDVAADILICCSSLALVEVGVAGGSRHC